MRVSKTVPWLGLAFALGGCEAPPQVPPPLPVFGGPCEPGDEATCSCTDGPAQTRVCTPDGTWGDCPCPMVCWYCPSTCAGRECGSTFDNESCGYCDPGFFCSLEGHCVDNCSRQACGPDGAGGSCGACPRTETCDAFGRCVPACQPHCEDSVCGDDGCGGSCGTCPPGVGLACMDGQCACQPQCMENGWPRACGDDGCGGSCGTCEDPYVCGHPYAEPKMATCACADDPVTLTYDASALGWGQGLVKVRGSMRHTLSDNPELQIADKEIVARLEDPTKTRTWVRERRVNEDCGADRFELHLTQYTYEDGRVVSCDGPVTAVTGSASFVIPPPPQGCESDCACPLQLAQ